MLFALCLTQTKSVKTCKIEYSEDSSYSNFSTPVSGPIGSPFPVRFMDGTSNVYYHQASVVVNSTLEIVVRSSGVLNILTTDNNNTTISDATTNVPKLAVMLEVGLLGLLITILAFTLAICTGVIVILTRRGKYSYFKCIIFYTLYLSSELLQVPNTNSQ